jgi:hypothetical protein
MTAAIGSPRALPLLDVCSATESCMSLPSPRRIISDPLILGGRWHLADSTLAVGEVRLDHAARRHQRGYRYPGLSAAELAACLAFDFPATRESTVAMLAGTAVIACACGEDTSVVGTLAKPIDCVCGRVWRLRLLLDIVHEHGAPFRQSAPAAAVAVVAVP